MKFSQMNRYHTALICRLPATWAFVSYQLWDKGDEQRTEDGEWRWSLKGRNATVNERWEGGWRVKLRGKTEPKMRAGQISKQVSTCGKRKKAEEERVTSVDKLSGSSRVGQGRLGTVEAAPWWDTSWEGDTYLIPRGEKEWGHTTPLIDWQCLSLSFTIHSHSSTLAGLPAMKPRAESSSAQ